MSNVTVRAMRRDLHKLLTRRAKKDELTIITVVEEGDDTPVERIHHANRDLIADARRRGARCVTVSNDDL
jgi:hypothetical protein